jgi:hypothetical protein
MTQLTLDTTQVQQLGSGPTLVECRDPAGKLVGFLHVAGRNDAVRVPDVTAEQLAAYEQEPGGRNLQEILSDLRKRRS